MRKKIKETKSTFCDLDNRCNSIMSRDKDYLLGELVNYDQDSVKPGG